MYKLGKYNGKDKMCDLICEHYPMLLVLSRFGIALGFGDKNIEEVCNENGVDVKTFLIITNLLLDDPIEMQEIHSSVSIDSLITYLQNSHTYFLDFRLPAIRRNLIDAIDCGKSDVSFAIMRFFDEYAST